MTSTRETDPTETDIRAQLAVLRESEQSYRNQFAANSSVMLLIDPSDAAIIDANAAALVFYGYSREQLLAMRITEINTRPVPEIMLALQSVPKGEGLRFEFEHRLADGSLRNVEVSASSIQFGGRDLLHSIIHDITASKRAKQRLMESEERHRLFFEQSRDAMMTLAPPVWKFTSGNPAARAMFGAKDEAEFTALGPWDVSPERQPDGRPSDEEARAAIATAMREGSHFFDWTHRTLDGRDFPTTVLLTRMVMAGQTFVQAIVRDITAQRQAEQALRAERDLFSAGPVCTIVWEVSKHWPVRQVSSNSAAILGYTADEMMAPAFRYAGLLHPEDLDRALQEVADHIERHEDTYEQSYRLKTKNGAYRWFYDFSRLVRNDRGGVEFICGYLFDQSWMKEAETALDQERQRLDDILRGTRAGTWEWNVQTGEVVFNERWAEIIGYTLEELAPVSIGTWRRFAHPNDLKKSRALLERHFRCELDYYECDSRVRHKDGHWVWVQDRGKVATWTHDGKPLLMRGTHQDINERKLAEEKLQLAASVFTHAREGIVITTADGAIIEVNDAFTHITGYRREEVLGRNPRVLKSGQHPKAFYVALWRSLIDKGHWSGEIWNRRKSGELFAEILTISAVRNDQGKTLHYVALFSDITAFKEHQRQLEHIAHYDALTRLPNRVLLADRLHQAMVQTRRRGQQLAVAYLDLDGFKTINDTHGHAAGDQLLITVAARMSQALRQDDTLARLGGDEFVAVLVDLTDIGSTERLLTRLLAAVAEPVPVADFTHRVTVSLGVTLYPQADEVDADQLLRQADQAMYQAKLAGKNRYHLFDAEHDRSARGHHESLEHIRHALTEGQFVLHYQPKVNMRAGTVIGAEALIRWQHPERGLLPPAMFLPVIENHPLAVELGEWVIETALTQMDDWRARGLDLPVSVNIGARQLQQVDFVERLRALLLAHPGIEPSSLGLEVLETSALEDLAHVSQVIAACRELGVACALDDFGTGYSSLTYLKRLPVTLLKIDQSFVRDMLDDPEDLTIVESVMGLAAAFRRQVIAEGVETLEHGELLLRLGCDLAQGYGIARPMPAQEIPGWSAAWRAAPQWIDLPLASRVDLPLLYVGVEHRAWIAAIDRHLQDQRDAPPPLDPGQCRFGQWLLAEELAGQREEPALESIADLHQGVHALAAELLEIKARGRTQEALGRLGELHQLRAGLLDGLRTLMRGDG